MARAVPSGFGGAVHHLGQGVAVALVVGARVGGPVGFAEVAEHLLEQLGGLGAQVAGELHGPVVVAVPEAVARLGRFRIVGGGAILVDVLEQDLPVLAHGVRVVGARGLAQGLLHHLTVLDRGPLRELLESPVDHLDVVAIDEPIPQSFPHRG